MRCCDEPIYKEISRRTEKVLGTNEIFVKYKCQVCEKTTQIGKSILDRLRIASIVDGVIKPFGVHTTCPFGEGLIWDAKHFLGIELEKNEEVI